MIAMTEAELADAIDGLHAYDVGAHDSGIHDEALREKVRGEVAAMDAASLDRIIAEITPASQGYGPQDVEELREWLRDEMGATSI